MRRPGVWVANGTPGDSAKMVSWRPGALTSFYDYLSANRVLDYKTQHPEVPIIVRFQHPQQWHQDPTSHARAHADMIASKWPDLRAMDPYVYFANELNLHYENGDSDVGRQPQYESREFYQKYASWVKLTADQIKQRVPEMKLVCPPFAFGHHEDGAPDDSGNPKEGWAGYDYLADVVHSHFADLITFHAYWGHSGGSVHDWLYDATQSSWYAFRWRRVLNLFERRYNLRARLIIDEAGNFGASDGDFTDQIMYHARQCLADSRVLAVTYFLWEDPSRSPGNLPNAWAQRCRNLDDHIGRLSAMPDVTPEPGLPAPSPLPPSVPAPPAAAPLIRVLMPDGTVQALDLEEYVRGVVPTEMPSSWPLEALKVQAVAARSYALVAAKRPRHGPDADVCSTTHCQAYNPSRVKPSTDQAVQATKGQVMLYQGELATAYYSANCGGHTRANEAVWSGPPVPYLRPVSCINPGPKNGHGVGMCQWGAHDMAARGDDYAAILKHYYTGVTISTAPALPPTPSPSPSPPTGSAVIHGVVADQAGRPRANVRLRLIRTGWSSETVSGPDGKYSFQQLSAGVYSLLAVAYAVRQDGLTLADGQELVLNLTIQVSQGEKWAMEIVRRPGLPVLAGSLPRAGIEVTLMTPVDSTLTTLSGSKRQYGVGGFEFWAAQIGTYVLRFLDQVFEVTMDGQLTQVTFTEGPVKTGEGVISGRLRDQFGRTLAGRQITLTGTGLSRTANTDSSGAYRFASVPAGTFTLAVTGTQLTRSVTSDGRSPLTVDLTLPSTPSASASQWLMKVARTPGPSILAGSMPEAGVTLTITPPTGSAVEVVSGSQPTYGAGGFETPAPARGVYTLRFLDQTFKLQLDGQFTRVTFIQGGTLPPPESQVRLVSKLLPATQANTLLQYLETNAQTRGIFSLEQPS
jgi:hypothetical protein